MGKAITIGDRTISPGENTYIIGEMACAHQGEVAQAEQLVDAIAAAKADCVQLQIFQPEANMVPTADLYSTLEQLHFTPAIWQSLADRARNADCQVSIFVYDEPSLDIGLSVKPDLLKLNSSELSNPPLVKATAESGLPFTLGTGSSTFEEIAKALSIIDAAGAGDRVILAHGVQNFPTPIEEANINRIGLLQQSFGRPVMFADHTSGDHALATAIDLVALGAGAVLLEKHVTLDRGAQGVDWQAALEPGEFSTYVYTMRVGASSLGPNQPMPLNASDAKYRRFQKKSVVARRDLTAGSELTAKDVVFLRVQGPQEGIAPADFDRFAGWRLRRDMPAYGQLFPHDLLPPEA
ncbi:MAG: N-acetylneuraminate synthase family protein [Pseudomonadota bacterium]